MIKLLVIDDEILNLRIIQESLEESGYVLVLARTGEEAICILENETSNFSAIILDRLMPGMDGMEVLRYIKKNPKYEDIPIILQTALGENENVAEGLEAGAFFYLTKPYSKRVLTSTIHIALENYFKFKKAKNELKKYHSISRLFRDGTFSIRTFEDVQEIAPVISNAFPNPRKALIGTIELLQNAIEHGNLEIGFEEKQKFSSSQEYSRYIEDLLCKEPYKSREVKIQIDKNDILTSMTITDQGKGFDYKTILNNKGNFENLFHTSGRGILISRSACFDKLEYFGNGNTVRVESYWKNSQCSL